MSEAEDGKGRKGGPGIEDEGTGDEGEMAQDDDVKGPWKKDRKRGLRVVMRTIETFLETTGRRI